MKLGIVGLPNVGKSTLFNSLTKSGIEAANYPFCTIDPNIGIVPVPDHRLAELAKIHNTNNIIPAVIEFVDIAGLVKGASKGEGLGNKFLSHIREVDAIVHVVRCFDDDNIIHVEGNVDPLRDIETINFELIFSDLEILDKRYLKVSKLAKNDKSLQKELNLIEKIKVSLESGISARSIEMTDEEKEIILDFNLLTTKPVLYAVNVIEDDLINDAKDNLYVQQVKKIAQKENSEAFIICAKIEEEIAELDEEERKMFLEELGVSDSGLERIVKSSYSLLGLLSYLTAGPKEVRAWTIKKGMKAPQAAGKIHTDFEKGFIKAEVISYEDLIRMGSNSSAKEAGLLRIEGKDYIVQDGDVILFRFNL